MAIQALIPVLAPLLTKVVGNLFPDAESKQKAEQEVMMALMSQSNELHKAAASIINTEAASQHWLAANWRPLTMLIFVGLIVARWFGWAAPDLSPEEYIKLWDIVELSIGGYVIGRSAEKIAPRLIDKIK